MEEINNNLENKQKVSLTVTDSQKQQHLSAQILIAVDNTGSNIADFNVAKIASYLISIFKYLDPMDIRRAIELGSLGVYGSKNIYKLTIREMSNWVIEHQKTQDFKWYRYELKGETIHGIRKQF